MAAQAALKTIATAMENFYIINSVYPSSADSLTTATPQYLSRDYFAGTYSGFTYSHSLAPGSYAITATPVTLGQTGTTIYTITTGGVFQ